MPAEGYRMSRRPVWSARVTANTSPEPVSVDAVTVAARQAQDGPARPDRGTMLVLLAGIFMAILDFFIVNVAIPSIQRDLHASPATIQFIVAGFALAYGAGLIVGGRCGDIFGRRRMFVVGMALFTASSAACGVAPNATFLVIGRVCQGLSAALMSPQVLTIMGAAYQGEARARAINAYGVTMGIAAVFGQLIGGLLIQADIFGLSWRACFLINVPIGIVAIALAPRFVPESRAPGRPRVDLGGMILVSLALAAVVLPLIEGREEGWPLWAWLCLAVSVPLFALFAAYEHRVPLRGGSPLIDLNLFRERAFTVGLLTQLLFFTGMASFFLVFALYIQLGRGLSPLDSGLLFSAIGAGYMATSTTARKVAAKLGRQVIALGGLLRMVGLGLLLLTMAAIGVTGHTTWFIPALIIDGAGMGLAVAPLVSTVLSRITPQHAGAASGVLSTGQQIGSAAGVAIIGIIFYGALPASPGLNDYTNAFRFSLVYLIGVGLTLAVLVQFLPRKPR
jgi:EmrB/QacA subfamily drug resistance transporter